jgi:hypothetical protein
MRNLSARSALIAGTALGGALVWGAVELVALQWSWLTERLRNRGLGRSL